MNEYTKIVCPGCRAVNGPGAPVCHTCGQPLLRSGSAARPVDDDEDEPPRKPLKKPAPDAVQKGMPPKKKPAPRPMDDEDEEEVRKPAKKVSRRDDDDDDDEEVRRPAKKKSRRNEDEPDDERQSIRDNTLLNMLFPVGVSMFAIGANYLGVLGLLGVFFGGALAAGAGIKLAGLILPLVGAFLGFLALIVGVLSFIIRPKKTTYGSVTGYMRAIIGILCGLLALGGGPILVWLMSTHRLI